jgi:hypothetical protein
MVEKDDLAAQTASFFLFGSLLGIIIPLGISIYFHFNERTPLRFNDTFLVYGIYFLIIGFFPLIAFLLYYYLPNWKHFINILMYLVGLGSVCVNFVLVQNSGGIDKSLFKFYFYFIPAAIAIAYRSKLGIILTASLCCYFVIKSYTNPPQYSEEIQKALSSESYGFYYCITVIFHFISIVFLELFGPCVTKSFKKEHKIEGT